jgi:amino acid transporter
MRLALLGIGLFYAVGTVAVGGGIAFDRISAGWPAGTALRRALHDGLGWPLELLALLGL